MELGIIHADNFRRRFHYDSYSPINIISLAIEALNNLTIVWFPMNKDVSGCCYKMEYDYIIFVNSNHSKGRQNFTIAHELYHLLYKKEDDFILCNSKNNSDEIEKEADNFASHVLLPDSALYYYMESNHIEKWSLKNIIRCEQYFQISHSALLKKLKKESLISDGEYESFKPDIIMNATRLGFSPELYEPSPENKKYYSIGSLIPLVEESFEKNRISKGKRDEILLDAFRSDYVFNLKEGDNLE